MLLLFPGAVRILQQFSTKFLHFTYRDFECSKTSKTKCYILINFCQYHGMLVYCINSYIQGQVLSFIKACELKQIYLHMI